MPLTETAEALMLDDYLGSTLVLFTVMPTDESPGTEVVGGSYTGQPTNLAQSISDPSRASNAEAIIFENMPDCTVVGHGIKNAGGNLLYYQSLSVPRPYAAGAIVTVPADTLIVTTTA